MAKLIYPYRNIRPCMSFRCNFKCSYCGIWEYQKDLCNVNKYIEDEKPVDVWIKRLNELEPTRPYFMVILGNTEVAIYKDFHRVPNEIPWNTRIYTNASTLSMKELMKVNNRDNLELYISYHSEFISCEEFITNVLELKNKFSIIDCHTIPTPEIKNGLPEDKKKMAEKGINLVIGHPYLVTKPGEYNFYDKVGEMPKFKNRFAVRCGDAKEKTVFCKTSYNHNIRCNTMGYPVAPNGDIYTCWRYILNKSKEGILGNFFDEDFQFNDSYYECDHYGDCNACGWDKNIIDKETGKQLDTDIIGWQSL